ncbi:uncharacterized protein SPSK_00020 [Sporothrix schenckii 1099-18]|uniref:Zn(2)-C6 fungal-type domain-containing protein n=1 Tax=Sporothrix schenckii 1099-18 TaxID=1397361 RepID=A0A0F2LSF8_SPOSC|nr:uncharacterized protein SPSK_00020 [Sporothrix schenckii 1099-18]KJR79804.1 hypothetical protein SPSK_00020 [Sporothrix schenckii 1099-18]
MADAQHQTPAITKACDLCRKKKIRCQRTPDGGCAQCTRANVADCHFTPIATKKKARRPPGHKQIAILEERLRRTEGLLQDAVGKLGTEPSRSESKSSTPSSTNPVQHPLAMMEENLAQLSPPPQILTWKGMMALGPFSLPSFHPLPPHNVAIELVEEAFSGFYDFYPLFDKSDFLLQFRANYAHSSSSTDPAWWACINTVLSLAYRLRAMRAVRTSGDLFKESQGACGHIHNALAVLSELLLLHDSFPAVQALVGMAAVLQGTPNPHSASVLVTAALRMAQGMGFHRRTCRDDMANSTLSEEEKAQRRRVFWIAFCIDKDISLRTGQPFAQDDDDMDPALPPALKGVSNVAHGIFHARIGLAVIQGQIYKKLYSVQASRQSVADRAAVADELNLLLHFWKSSGAMVMDEVGLTGDLCTTGHLHKLILRFTYVNCLAMVDPYVAMPQNLQESSCVSEAREALPLIRNVPRGDFFVTWALLRPLFSAVTVVLENVIRNPGGTYALSSCVAVEHAIQLLSMLAANNLTCSRSQEARHMYPICLDLHIRANNAFQQVSLNA